jgi:exosortase family protein XrtF
MPLAVKFIAWFLGSYLLLQFAYTGYLWLYEPAVDPITLLTAEVLIPFFDGAQLVDIPGASKVQFQIHQKAVVNIKEGCNGLSVMIALISFLLAYKGSFKAYMITLPLSIIALFIANFLRLYALIQIRLNWPNYFVFFHEYLFPSILYFFAFAIMVLWVRKVGSNQRTAPTNSEI